MQREKDRRLLVATHNKGKVTEYADLLEDLALECLTLDDVGITREAAETGETFLENAVMKASAYSRQTGLYTLADDSGLEVDYLGGLPGVHTARYGGEGLTATERYNLLLKNLAGVPWERRTARFHCVIALAGPNGDLITTADGICEGLIALKPIGEGGFGYDPVFFLPDQGLTMAQLSPTEKHRISHRGRALVKIAPSIRQILGIK
jgi:XTP/dITP diphosphohydrolase